ncbi:MAG: serine/threonine protein kinase [Planctomycetes bacterium]|nr:serine/threonine protein kinase [Planctomycetota bacterium]
MSDAKDLSSSSVTFELAAHTLQRALPEYRILREIGAGSMGTVFEALDTSLNRKVAIKVLPPSTSQNDTRKLRFKREVEAIARLTHPNIVPIYTVGSSAGLHYFAMGYVSGGSLADVLRQHGPLPALKAFRMMRQIVLAIQEAHRLGVIHRDIKPGNLLVEGEEKLILTDFGLARPEGTETMTETGAIVGTPMYMAPEQILGEKSKIDSRCDLYAIGATLYQMLTGLMPFSGETTTAVLRAVLEKPPLPFARAPKPVPKDAQKIVLKLLNKDPADRYQDAAALLRDIDHLLDGEPVEATLPGVVTRVQRSVRRHPIASSIVAGVAVLAVILLLTQNRRFEQRDRTRDEEITRLRYDAELTRLSEGARSLESEIGSTWTYAGKIDDAIEQMKALLATSEAQRLFDPSAQLSPEEAQMRAGIVSRTHPFLSALYYYRSLSEDARTGDLEAAQRICREGLVLAPDDTALEMQEVRVEFARSMSSIRQPGDAVRAYSIVGAARESYRAFGLELSTRLAEAMLERAPSAGAQRKTIHESTGRALELVINETALEGADPMRADPLVLRERARALFVNSMRDGIDRERLQKEATQLIEIVRDRLPAEPHTQALRARILERGNGSVAEFLRIGAGVATQLGGSAIEAGAEATGGLLSAFERLLPKAEKRADAKDGDATEGAKGTAPANPGAKKDGI